MKITIDEEALRAVLYECVSRLLGEEFQITEVDGNMQRYADRVLYAIKNDDRRPEVVDRIIRAVAECHDGSELWGHLRRDPSAFRMAVRAALKQFGSETCRALEIEDLLAR